MIAGNKLWKSALCAFCVVFLFSWNALMFVLTISLSVWSIIVVLEIFKTIVAIMYIKHHCFEENKNGIGAIYYLANLCTFLGIHYVNFSWKRKINLLFNTMNFSWLLWTVRKFSNFRLLVYVKIFLILPYKVERC